MTIEYRSFSFTPTVNTETRAAGVAGDKLAGHAIVYNRDSHDLGGFIERVAPGALTRSLKAAEAGDLSVYALWSHDSSQPLGSTRGGKLKLTSDAEGLAFELDTTRFTLAQLDAARDGDLQMSFGFRVVKDSWVRREDGVAERTLIDVDLYEVSPVISPAYPDTTAALRSLEAWEATDARIEAAVAVLTEDYMATMVADGDNIRASREVEAALEAFIEGERGEANQPKENIALNIKRALMLKAIEQHIRGLPAA